MSWYRYQLTYATNIWQQQIVCKLHVLTNVKSVITCVLYSLIDANVFIGRVFSVHTPPKGVPPTSLQASPSSPRKAWYPGRVSQDARSTFVELQESGARHLRSAEEVAQPIRGELAQPIRGELAQPIRGELAQPIREKLVAANQAAA